MGRFILSPIPAQPVLTAVVPIEHGGTSGASGADAANKLGAIHNSNYNVANGVAQRNASGGVPDEIIPQGAGGAVPSIKFSLSGDDLQFLPTQGNYSLFVISNYDDNTTYTFTTVLGKVIKAKDASQEFSGRATPDTYCYVGIKIGTETMTLNGRAYTFEVAASSSNIVPPYIYAPSSGTTDQPTSVQLYLNTYNSYTNEREDFQLTDIEYRYWKTTEDISLAVYNKLSGLSVLDGEDPPAVSISNLDAGASYYFQLRFKDTQGRYSEWSDGTYQLSIKAKSAPVNMIGAIQNYATDQTTVSGFVSMAFANTDGSLIGAADPLNAGVPSGASVAGIVAFASITNNSINAETTKAIIPQSETVTDGGRIGYVCGADKSCTIFALADGKHKKVYLYYQPPSAAANTSNPVVIKPSNSGTVVVPPVIIPGSASSGPQYIGYVPLPSDASETPTAVAVYQDSNKNIKLAVAYIADVTQAPNFPGVPVLGKVAVYDIPTTLTDISTASFSKLTFSGDASRASSITFGASLAFVQNGSFVAVQCIYNGVLDANNKYKQYSDILIYNTSNVVVSGGLTTTDIGADPGLPGSDSTHLNMATNGDGSLIAFGRPTWNNDGSTAELGMVRLYNVSSAGALSVFGSDIRRPNGDASPGHFGQSVSLSDDGTILAVGAPAVLLTNQNGEAWVFVQTSNGWADGKQAVVPDTSSSGVTYTGCGSAVALSGDGTVLIVVIPGMKYPAASGIAWTGAAMVFK